MILCTNVRSRVCVHTTCTCVQLHMHLHVSYVQSLQKKRNAKTQENRSLERKKNPERKRERGRVTRRKNCCWVCVGRSQVMRSCERKKFSLFGISSRFSVFAGLRGSCSLSFARETLAEEATLFRFLVRDSRIKDRRPEEEGGAPQFFFIYNACELL